MVARRTAQNEQTRWRTFLAVLSIALILLVGVVSVAHTHAAADVSHADCGLCATAHVSIQVVAAPVIIPAALTESRVQSARTIERPRTLTRFALFTRPPPADAHPA